MSGKQQAEAIYTAKTLPSLAATQGVLHQMRATACKAILTDEVVLEQAQDCKTRVSLLRVLATRGGLRRLCGRMEEGAAQV